ncbi:MAG: hypothetical protein ACK4KT_04355 [Thermaurantimonas sp.]
MRPLLIFAHREEAEILIQYFGAKVTQAPHYYRCYSSEKADLLITGTGVFNMMASIIHHLSTHKENHFILNIGLAGSHNRPLYSWYAISSVHYPPFKTHYTDPIFSTLDYASLKTVNRPASSEEMKVAPDFLFDMEGYSFVQSAKRFFENHRIHLIKFVSDHDGKMDSIKSALQQYNTSVPHIIESALKAIQKADTRSASSVAAKSYFEKINEFGQNQRLSFSQIQLLTEQCIYHINSGNKNIVDQLLNQDFLSVMDRDQRFTQILNHLNRNE